jgi:DNA modification methylase
VDVTITSPPYFDMKDYGRPNQIGFGQGYDEYLSDLSTVFTEVFRATKSDGSLWIIVDTFRKDQEVVPLPFDLVSRLKPTGWTLRDIVIWKKERTVPWAHTGATKRIFEYILVFSKGSGSFKYDQDKFREVTDLKRWWVRYPERYNPRGKAPEEIWSYDIPVQGSWGDHYVRHFCPLPTELVSRIIQQTTESQQVVLDPFAGSGTVPTVSKLLNRRYVGFELNSEYVGMFKKHLQQQLKLQKQSAQDPIPEDPAAAFEATIVSLRILKFGRLLLRQLHKDIPSAAAKVFAFRSTDIPTEKFKHYSAEYLIKLHKPNLEPRARAALDLAIAKPPLSKFGIQATYEFVSDLGDFDSKQKRADYFEYTITNSHFHSGRKNLKEALEGKGLLFSPIKAEVEEPNG